MKRAEAEHEDPVPAQQVGERASGQKQRRQHQRIGVDHPLEVGERCGRPTAGCRQRDVDHRDVEQQHERGRPERATSVHDFRSIEATYTCSHAANPRCLERRGGRAGREGAVSDSALDALRERLECTVRLRGNQLTLEGDEASRRECPRRDRRAGRARRRIQPTRAVEIHDPRRSVHRDGGATIGRSSTCWPPSSAPREVEGLFDPLRVVAARTRTAGRGSPRPCGPRPGRATPAGGSMLRMELARVNQEELGNPVAAAETWSQVLADHRHARAGGDGAARAAGARADRQDWVGVRRVQPASCSTYVPADERPQVEYAIGRDLPRAPRRRGRRASSSSIGPRRPGWSEPDLGPGCRAIRARRGQWRRVIQLMVQQAAAQEIGEASPTLLRAGIIASSVHLEEEAFKVYHALLERAPSHVVALRHVARLHHRAHEHEKRAGVLRAAVGDLQGQGVRGARGERAGGGLHRLRA